MTDNETTSSIRGERDLANAQDIIVCEGVSKWFGDFQALNNVSATIKEHEVVVVLGPSGSGKKYLAKLIHNKSKRNEAAFVIANTKRILTNNLENDLISRWKINDPHLYFSGLQIINPNIFSKIKGSSLSERRYSFDLKYL